MESPSVSVVVPVYNVEPYLRECLDSLAGQSLSDIEVICVNDGSTDGSLALAQEYARLDQRFSVIDQPNQGPSGARNAGTAVARGRYVQFIDGDDVLVPDALMSLHELASANSADIVYFDATSFFDSDELEEKHKHYTTYYTRNSAYPGVYPGPALFTSMVTENDWLPSVCLQFFDREFYRRANLRFQEGIIHEDNLFTIQSALQAQKAMHLGRPLYRRRLRPESVMTARKSEAHVHGYLCCCIETVRFCHGRRFDDATGLAIARVVDQMYRGAAKAYCLLDGDARSGLQSPDSSPDALLAYSRCIEAGTAELAKRGLARELGRCKDSLAKIKNSRSYRIIRALRRAVPFRA